MLVTLILSLVLMGALFLMILAAVAFIQDKRLFTTAPKDIQEAVKEHEERFPGARVTGWTLLVIAIIMFPFAFVYGAWNGIQHGFSFWKFAGRFLAMLYLLKVFDVIFLDWFLLTKSHFYQHYYPETEGCAGYRQFSFKWKSCLVLFPVFALLGAGICMLF